MGRQFILGSDSDRTRSPADVRDGEAMFGESGSDLPCCASRHSGLFARELALLSITTFWTFLREFSPFSHAG
ncbi:MAG: hypothetical protein O3C17_20325, partial [Planctomycetota bacterium]|nr:hypothetical protein [Planctomycetota bacterium]